MNTVAAVADILKREGTEFLFCFPVNALIDECARFGIRPIVARTERTLLNTTDRGGPGGIRVSCFGRADLRHNRIVANDKGGAHGAEGGVICVLEDNVMEGNGAKREPAKPSFRLTGEISARRFDARAFVTEIKTGAPLKENLAGSAVRIGKVWSVIKSSSPDSLVVWGKFTDEAPKFEVLDHYRPKNPQ